MIVGTSIPMCPYCGKPVVLGHPHESCVTEYSRFMDEASNVWERDTPKNLTGRQEMDFESVSSIEVIENLEEIMGYHNGCLVLNESSATKLVNWLRSMIVLTKDQGEFIKFLKAEQHGEKNDLG